MVQQDHYFLLHHRLHKKLYYLKLNLVILLHLLLGLDFLVLGILHLVLLLLKLHLLHLN
jgi:hypothetical protein